MPDTLLRPYRADDEDATIRLWQQTWQIAYPDIDFAARVDWWRKRWHDELVPNADIIVAEKDGSIAGFVTIDATGYLDQLVVGTAYWGSNIATSLVDAAKSKSPQGITLLVNADNHRAISFYKRNRFTEDGTDVNQTSGRPVMRMRWQP